MLKSGIVNEIVVEIKVKTGEADLLSPVGTFQMPANGL
jgi:hypothetical protein